MNTDEHFCVHLWPVFFRVCQCPQSLWAGAGCRRASIFLGLIRLRLYIGQAGLDEEQMRRLVPAGIPRARTVEGNSHVVPAPGEPAIADLAFEATGGAEDLDIGAWPDRFVQLDARAGTGNVLQVGNRLEHGLILMADQDVDQF